MNSTGIALVGCGFVADYYLASIANYPSLRIQGVYDRDTARLRQFCDHYSLRAYPSLESLLADDGVRIVVNLTNPRSHYEISKQSLEAGKHVYSEKPLAMRFEDAKALVELARSRRLVISSAPCSVLGEAARTLSYAVRQGVVGKIRLVYAELEDGMVHQMAYRKWVSDSGAPWPYRDEFEVGCTLEHAGYYVAWLMEMFGPVESVTAFSDCLVPDKLMGEAALEPPDTADASFGILKFKRGVVARLSTTIVAPHDHSIRVIGDRGVLSLKDCWNNDEKVNFYRRLHIRRRTLLSPVGWRVRLPNERKGAATIKTKKGSTQMDFLLGVHALAEHIVRGMPLQLSPEFSLHVNEIALALQYAGPSGSAYVPESTF